MSVWVWVAIALLGGFAAIARFLLGTLVSRVSGSDLPLGTFAINVSGAFVLGLVAGFGASGYALVLIGTGALGSFTTFSTWMLESHRLRDQRRFRQASGNLAIGLFIGFAAVALGHTIAVHL